jgi:3-hydroxybutyrate dehydrogenase
MCIPHERLSLLCITDSCVDALPTTQSANNFWNDQDTDSYKILRVNLEHPLKMSRMAIRKMLQADQSGIIVLVSSTGAQKASILTPLYQAAKAGISTFTRCMAKLTEMGGIRVVAVAPGPTMSPLMYDHPEAFRFVDPEKDRLASPDEIARGMMGVCFDKKFPPGTVLEVTHQDRWREVALLNDPGPDASAWTSRKDEAISDVAAIIKADREGSF